VAIRRRRYHRARDADVYRHDGEPLARFHTHATDEAEAQAQCNAFFRDHPEYDPRAENPDLMIRVEIARA
jgi:hypothetical protein